nr:insulin-like peptide INSL6 [Cavia porcellus]
MESKNHYTLSPRSSDPRKGVVKQEQKPAHSDSPPAGRAGGEPKPATSDFRRAEGERRETGSAGPGTQCAVKVCAASAAAGRGRGRGRVGSAGRGWGGCGSQACWGRRMKVLFCFSSLWLGLLLICLSQELDQLDELNIGISIARKLCGSNLQKAIVKLCGDTDWSHFQLEEIPLVQLVPQATGKTEALDTDQFGSSEMPFPVWGAVTNPGSTSASQGEAIKSWEIQSLPQYQYKKTNLLLDKIREFPSSHDGDPNIHKAVKFQKKNTNKIKASSNLFWGNHPQRKRRGFSDKCCLKGCTKEELAIACIPYIFKTYDKKTVT